MNEKIYCEHVNTEAERYLMGNGLVFWLGKDCYLFLCQKCKDAVFGQIMKEIMEKNISMHSFTSRDVFGS